MTRKPKTAPVEAPTEAPTEAPKPARTRGTQREVAIDTAARLVRQLSAILAHVRGDATLEPILVRLVEEAEAVSAHMVELPTDYKPAGPVGRLFAPDPKHAARFKYMPAPLEVIEVYMLGRSEVCTVKASDGSKGVNVVLSQLKPWIAPPAADEEQP